MNFKYLIFLCLMFIVSIGAVSAADDVNNTVDNTVDADTAIIVYQLIQLLWIVLFMQIMLRNIQ